MSRVLSVISTVTLIVLTGCKSSETTDWIPSNTPEMLDPAAYAPAPISFGRVAVLPIWAGSSVRESQILVVEAALQQSLQSAGRFEIVYPSPTQLEHWFGTSVFTPTQSLPPGLFDRLKIETAADAVLFFEITAMSSYPPLSIGIRSRLERLDGSGTVWAVDHFFNANDSSVALAARRFQQPNDPNSGSILLSPSQFALFATSELVKTIPPRMSAKVAANARK